VGLQESREENAGKEAAAEEQVNPWNNDFGQEILLHRMVMLVIGKHS